LLFAKPAAIANKTKQTEQAAFCERVTPLLRFKMFAPGTHWSRAALALGANL
jgi:hypothetical protein